MDALQKLNDNQKNAATHTEGPLLILAGAGSGKTRVITHRIAYLIHEKGVRPFSIFAVTFTNKAAEEMRKRIIDLIGPSGVEVFIKTFHSASVYILRRFGERIGIPKNFSIYDQSDQESVIKEILVEMRLDPKKIKPSTIASTISEIKDKESLIDGTDISLLTPDHFYFNFTELYQKYHSALASRNALDFNDLLIKTVQLLRDQPEILHELQRRWKYIMVDEYQDTNYAQYLITKYLAEHHRNICVVGDDDQSIYSWRGADIKNILNFEKDYPETKIITLKENYRSTVQILQTATAIIKNNIQRKEKNLFSCKGNGEQVVWCQTNNEYGEAEFAISTIISLKYRENLRNQDFAIFYRTNAQSRLFEDRLRMENLPYRVVGGLKFYDRKEIKDILSYLKFIINPSDQVSLLRIINTPTRGIGKATIEKLNATAQEEHISMWEVILKDRMPGKKPEGLHKFKGSLLSAMGELQGVPHITKLSAFIHDVIEKTGYRKAMVEENTPESKSRVENIDEFINSIFDYEIIQPESGLDEFLQNISLYTAEENPQEDPEDKNNVITLMTVHNAKGLEFPVVFLTGMEENLLPHKFSIDTEAGIEEERRLCYVGITRGMDRVYLTNAELRRFYSGVYYSNPSRFLDEIPKDLLAITYYNSEQAGSQSGFHAASPTPAYEPSTYSGKNYSSPAGAKDIRETYSKAYNKGYSNGWEKMDFSNKLDTPDSVNEFLARQKSSDSKFKLRDNVMHPKYGLGRVVKIEGEGDNVKLSIIFSSGKKSFIEKYTPLEKVT